MRRPTSQGSAAAPVLLHEIVLYEVAILVISKAPNGAELSADTAAIGAGFDQAAGERPIALA